jgi:hypothetical protein
VNLKLRVFIHVLAWMVALGAVGAVIIGYDTLPDEIPVTRWSVAPKSLLIVLRVPLINLITIGLIEVLSGALHRAKQFNHADAVMAVLLLTAAAKAGIEAGGILASNMPPFWTLISLVAVLLVGLGTAAFLSREFLQPERWRQLQMTRLETIGVVVLVAGFLALNLPVLLRS